MEDFIMKKIFVLIGVAILALTACNQDLINTDLDEGKYPAITFNMSATHPDGVATKAVKTGWETNDVVFVFFSTATAPQYLEMKWDGSKWVNTEKNSLALAENATGTMRAVYLPFGSSATVLNSEGAYTFSETYYSYYLTATLDYTVTDGVVSGTFDMQIPEGYIQLFVDKADAAPGEVIELRNKNLTPQGIVSIASDGTITHTTSATGAPLPGYVYDKEVKASGESKGYLFSGILAAGVRDVKTDYHFTLVSGGWKGDYYKKSYTGKKLYTGSAAGRAVKLPAIANWTKITEYFPIDLGIDVRGKRVYWAEKNLGASSEAGAGDYYSWGEIEPYYTGDDPQVNPASWKSGKESGYNWPSYTRYTTDNGASFTKYTYTGDWDTPETLEPKDDAANVVLGGDWRVPTMFELMEGLHYSAQGIWVVEGESGSSQGHRITSKHAGYSSSIFLPWQGYRNEKSINEVFVNGGGTLWTSTRHGGTIGYAHAFDFGLGGADWGSSWRVLGRAIRPVTD